MITETLTGAAYLSMLMQGAARLCENRQAVNDLNVFPIPDGDTGDNMYMTIDAGCNSAAGDTISEVAASASRGMLLGARGNSGVILSRIFAGLSKGLDGLSEADPAQFAQAMGSAVKEAYGAVSTPVEGTILTVLRESVEAAGNKASFEEYFDALVPAMEESLKHTPELLAVLKEAGVVDSGGAGLVLIARGMAESLRGITTGKAAGGSAPAHDIDLDKFGPDTPFEFGYCTEFLLRLRSDKVDLDSFDESEIRDYLNGAGESVVCFRDGSIVKVHVHTFDPGSILSHCRRWGEYLTLKIENMTLQHNEAEEEKAEAPADFLKARKPYGIVTVASGTGLVNTLREAGADEVIEGGQTMNPSAASFIEAFDRLNAGTVFVFPNNSNIILTASQAAELYTSSRVIVIPSKDVGAGYVAIASMDLSDPDPDSIASAAMVAVESVSTGLVSKAIRDASRDGVDVSCGDFIGISGGAITCDSATAEEAATALAASLDAGSHDVVLVFSGEDVDAAAADSLSATLQKLYPRTEIIMTDGGQPVYQYIIVLC